MAPPTVAQTAAQAYADAARLQSLLTQEQRLRHARNADGATAAYLMAQIAVARLYEAIPLLPPEHPACQTAHQALDSVNLTFRPDQEPPHTAYTGRLAIIAAAPVTARMPELIKAHRQDQDLPRQLAETAARELVSADQHSRQLLPMPTAGWSKRQQRALETEVKASLAQTVDNTRRTAACYRATLPYTVMPQLAAAKMLPGARRQLLDTLDRHTEDHLHLLLNVPTGNADGEAATLAAVGLIHRQRRYLKTVGEDYPPGYPNRKAVSALRQVVLQLETQADAYRDPENRQYCQQAARQANALLSQLEAEEPTAIGGRISDISGDVITVTSITQATASPQVLDQAAALLGQEAVVQIVFDDEGAIIARNIVPHPDAASP